LRLGKAYGVVVLGSSKAEGFRQEDLSFLEEVAARIALALRQSRVSSELRQLRGRGGERLTEHEGAHATAVFDDIIGDSKQLLGSLNQVAIVAASDATVLVLGETGTGKDLIAKAIHNSSARCKQLLVKLNCAAIPTGLLESELFGHERGSFTDATSQKIGRMELAHHGTLFLDEIGEIPLELQPKLLRVLQDQEFERLGGNRTIRVDFRLIAATNRDLQKAVLDGQFRADLFYRLNVFPIRMPALRDRRSDIPDLVWHFVRKYEKRFSREIEGVSPEAMRALVAWPWPGNVRELENFIERSVILSESGQLRVPLDELHSSKPDSDSAIGSLEQTEREHILHVLRETGGALSGPRGAAERLGLKRTTLQSKMSRLGITRSLYWKHR
jgi:formate hydrogenlyase transcriptional activator